MLSVILKMFGFDFISCVYTFLYCLPTPMRTLIGLAQVFLMVIIKMQNLELTYVSLEYSFWTALSVIHYRYIFILWAKTVCAGDGHNEVLIH